MTDVTYIFGDVLTGEIIEEIRLFSVSMNHTFGAGELRGSLQLDQTGKSNADLINATNEGNRFVVCERNAVPIWGGFVRTRTYQLQSKTIQLYCQAWEHYPEYRLMRSALFEDLDTEQVTIFLNLWEEMMEDDNSVQFILPSTFTTVTKSLTVKDSEFKAYRSAMDSLANADDGFDWIIDVIRENDVYKKKLRIGYPTLGATSPVIFDYPGQIINYWDNRTMADHGTHFYGIGSGEGSVVLQQEVIHTDLLANGFPRFDSRIMFKDVLNQDALTGLSVQAAATRKPGVPILTIELKGEKEPEFGSYGLGDAARLDINDPFHPNPVDRSITSRIIGWEYYPPQDSHTEMARLVFPGQDV